MIRQAHWRAYYLKSVIPPCTRCSFSDTFMRVIFTTPLRAVL